MLFRSNILHVLFFLFHFFSDLVPITAEENYNYVLPQPSNLNDPAFEKLQLIQKVQSFSVTKQQKSDLEAKDQTINTLIGDLAKLRIKNDDYAKENKNKDERIIALTKMITKLRATDSLAQLKAEKYNLKQQHNRDKKIIESLRRRSVKGKVHPTRTKLKIQYLDVTVTQI